MDEFREKFSNMIHAYEEALSDRKLLKNILSDTFPENSKEVNLLLN